MFHTTRYISHFWPLALALVMLAVPAGALAQDETTPVSQYTTLEDYSSMTIQHRPSYFYYRMQDTGETPTYFKDTDSYKKLANGALVQATNEIHLEYYCVPGQTITLHYPNSDIGYTLGTMKVWQRIYCYENDGLTFSDEHNLLDHLQILKQYSENNNYNAVCRKYANGLVIGTAISGQEHTRGIRFIFPEDAKNDAEYQIAVEGSQYTDYDLSTSTEPTLCARIVFTIKNAKIAADRMAALAVPAANWTAYSGRKDSDWAYGTDAITFPSKWSGLAYDRLPLDKSPDNYYIRKADGTLTNEGLVICDIQGIGVQDVTATRHVNYLFYASNENHEYPIVFQGTNGATGTALVLDASALMYTHTYLAYPQIRYWDPTKNGTGALTNEIPEEYLNTDTYVRVYKVYDGMVYPMKRYKISFQSGSEPLPLRWALNEEYRPEKHQPYYIRNHYQQVSSLEFNADTYEYTEPTLTLDKPSYTPLDRTNWTITGSSEHSTTGYTNMIDGNTGTIWETDWSGTSTDKGDTHWFCINLGEQVDLRSFGYVARQNNNFGRLKDIEIYVSATTALDGSNYTSGTKVFSGTLESTNNEQRFDFNEVSAAVRAQYVFVYIQSVHAYGRDKTASCAEFNLSSLPLHPVTPLDRSQRTIARCSNHSGNDCSLMRDEDPSTFWESEWTGTDACTAPHWFCVTLPEETELGSFGYLPRQNSANGRFKEVEIWVSSTAALTADNYTTAGTLVHKTTLQNNTSEQWQNFVWKDGTVRAKYVFVLIKSVYSASTASCAGFWLSSEQLKIKGIDLTGVTTVPECFAYPVDYSEMSFAYFPTKPEWGQVGIYKDFPSTAWQNEDRYKSLTYVVHKQSDASTIAKNYYTNLAAYYNSLDEADQTDATRTVAANAEAEAATYTPGYFLYADASIDPLVIGSLKFKEGASAMCPGSKMIVSGYVSSLYKKGAVAKQNDGQIHFPANLILRFYGVDASGNRTQIHAFCTGNVSGNYYQYDEATDSYTEWTSEKLNASGVAGADNDGQSIWQQFCYDFVVPNVSYDHYVLELYSNCLGSYGGDMLVDDIRLYLELPETTVWQSMPSCQNATKVVASVEFEPLLAMKGVTDFDDYQDIYDTAQAGSVPTEPQGFSLWYCFVDKDSYDVGLAELDEEYAMGTMTAEDYNERLRTLFYANLVGTDTEGLGKENFDNSGYYQCAYFYNSFDLMDKGYMTYRDASGQEVTLRTAGSRHFTSDTYMTDQTGGAYTYTDEDGKQYLVVMPKLSYTELAPGKSYYVAFNVERETYAERNNNALLWAGGEVAETYGLPDQVYAKTTAHKALLETYLDKTKVDGEYVKADGVYAKGLDSPYFLERDSRIFYNDPDEDGNIELRTKERGDIIDPFTCFNLGDNCSPMSVFSVIAALGIRVDGIPESESDDMTHCAGAVAAVKVTMQGSTWDTEVGDGLVVPTDRFYDWYVGSLEDLQETRWYWDAASKTYAKVTDDTPAWLADGALTLYDCITAFRHYYPDATDASGEAPGDDGAYNYTEAKRAMLEYFSTAHEFGKMPTLQLYRAAVSLNIPELEVDERDNVHDFNFVVIPIEREKEIENIIFCYEPHEVTLKITGQAPTATIGFPEDVDQYPADVSSLPVRVSLAQMSEVKADKTQFLTAYATYMAAAEKDLTDEEKEKQHSTNHKAAAERAAADCGASYLYFPVCRYNKTSAAGVTNYMTLPKGDNYVITVVDTDDPALLASEEYQAAGNYAIGALVDIYAYMDVDHDDVVKNEQIAKMVLYDDFEPREGFYYVFNIPFGENISYTYENLSATGNCDGTILAQVVVVPEYLKWTGGAGNRSWNNDDNWQRADRAELLFADADEPQYPTNEANLTARGYTPLTFCKTVIPSYGALIGDNFPAMQDLGTSDGAKPHSPMDGDASHNIQYTLVLKQGKDLHSEGYDTRYFEPNHCKEVMFEPMSELLDAQHLQYEKAHAAFLIDVGRWYTLSSPLQGVLSGDMYVPAEGEYFGQERTPYFHDITFDENVNNRFDGGIYQKSWDKAEALVYRLPAAVATSHLKDNPYNVAQALNWSYTYNDVLIPYSSGEGFCIKADFFNVPTTLRGSAGNESVVRLPKSDTFYHYYNYVQGAEPVADKLVDLTDADVIADFQARYGFAPREGAGKLQSDRLKTAENFQFTATNRSTGDAGRYYFVGNPYMTGLDMQKFLTANADVIEQKYWLMTSSEQLGVVNGTASSLTADDMQVLPPFQGFFVKAKTDGTSLTVSYTAAMQSTLNSNKRGLWLHNVQPDAGETPTARIYLTAERDGFTSRAALVVNADAQADFDDGEDLELLYDSHIAAAPNLFTLAGTQAASINVLPSLACVPLGVVSSDAGDIALTLDGDLDAFPALCLYDAQEDEYAPLTAGETLTLQASPVGRYYLVDGTYTAPAEQIEPAIRLTGRTVSLAAPAAAPLQHVSVADATGRVLYTATLSGTAHTFRLPDRGVYLVTLRTTASTTTRRLFAE